MSVELDLSTDYKVFGGLAAVTCYRARSPQIGNNWNTRSGISIADARIQKINMVEVEPTAGVYDRADTRIRLPAVLMTAAGYVPSIGDTIEAADKALWIVLAVGHPRFNNSWSCECRQLLIAGGLCDLVSLLSATVTNVHGSKVTAHTATQTHVAARIQPMDEQEVNLQARLGFDVNYRIFTETDVAAGYDDLFEDEATNTLYEIKSSGARKRIDVLSTYYCRVRP